MPADVRTSSDDDILVVERVIALGEAITGPYSKQRALQIDYSQTFIVPSPRPKP